MLSSVYDVASMKVTRFDGLIVNYRTLNVTPLSAVFPLVKSDYFYARYADLVCKSSWQSIVSKHSLAHSLPDSLTLQSGCHVIGIL